MCERTQANDAGKHRSGKPAKFIRTALDEGWSVAHGLDMTSARCPRCTHRPPLETVRRAGQALESCGTCDGAFVARATLDQVSRDPERRRRLREALAVDGPQTPVTHDVRYLPCAICDERMTRRNHGGRSGIIVDVCIHHGTWFDATELARALSFAGPLTAPHGGEPRPHTHARVELPARKHVVVADEVAAGGGYYDVAEVVVEVALWSWLD